VSKDMPIASSMNYSMLLQIGISESPIAYPQSQTESELQIRSDFSDVFPSQPSRQTIIWGLPLARLSERSHKKRDHFAQLNVLVLLLSKVFAHVLLQEWPEWSRLLRIPLTSAQRKLNVIPLLRIPLSMFLAHFLPSLM
jgi:hypothetical protein